MKKILLAVAGILTVFVASKTAEFIKENTFSLNGWEWYFGAIAIITSLGFIFDTNKTNNNK